MSPSPSGILFTPIFIKKHCQLLHHLYNKDVNALTKKAIQPARFIVQMIFLIAVILGVNTKPFSDWMLPAILLAGVFFCGWVCPLGTAQDWMAKLGRALHLPRLKVPQSIQRILQLSRYILYLLLTLDIVFNILKGPYNFSRMLHGELLTAASALLLIFLLAGLFIDRPFCNYFCTGGARQGLWSVLRLFSIRRDSSRCGGCGQCTKACPMNIDVAHTDFVRHPNCIGCFSCISACRKHCLSYGMRLKDTKKDKA